MTAGLFEQLKRLFGALLAHFSEIAPIYYETMLTVHVILVSALLVYGILNRCVPAPVAAVMLLTLYVHFGGHN